MSSSLVIQIIAILISTSCSVLGVFLVLKNMSMLTDAITHTVLLGIVLAFFISGNLNSPLFIVGASLIGLVTVYLVELLVNTRLVHEDAAIAIVMSFLFSVAIVLISRYTANIHLDTDSVLLGEIAFTPFNKTNIFGYEIAVAIVKSFVVLIINVLFVIIFFKELKISVFDRALAASLGMYPVLMHYLLMTLVSVTSVVSFEAVGSILLISFMIGPPVTAYLLSKSLRKMMLLSIIFGAISSILGYNIAIILDVSIAGSISVVIGLLFIIVFLLKKVFKFDFRLRKMEK